MTEITPQFRAVLVSLANTPSNPIALAVTLDISTTTARKHLYKGLAGGYLEVINDAYQLTAKGNEAIVKADVVSHKKQTNVYCVAKPSKAIAREYMPYVPAPQPYTRPGAMDAYRLPSRTLAGREYPC